jgi:hypothetical protein
LPREQLFSEGGDLKTALNFKTGQTQDNSAIKTQWKCASALSPGQVGGIVERRDKIKGKRERQYQNFEIILSRTAIAQEIIESTDKQNHIKLKSFCTALKGITQ